MEGSADMLDMEVRCPNCMEWTYPVLPQAGTDSCEEEPEALGQNRLDELIGANDDVEQWHKRRRKHRQARRPAQPIDLQNQWYIMTSSGPQGPYANEQIVQFAKEGKINAANELMNARSKSIICAGKIPSLFGNKTEKTVKPVKSVKPEKTVKPSHQDWYVQTAKDDAGPFTSAKIIEFAKAGKIKPDTMLRKAESQQFIPASKINGLIKTKT